MHTPQCRDRFEKIWARLDDEQKEQLAQAPAVFPAEPPPAGSAAEEVEAIKAAWPVRLAGLFTDTPIPFRSQNGGDFPDRHTMADHVAPGQTGLVAHVADPVDA